MPPAERREAFDATPRKSPWLEAPSAAAASLLLVHRLLVRLLCRLLLAPFRFFSLHSALGFLLLPNVFGCGFLHRNLSTAAADSRQDTRVKDQTQNEPHGRFSVVAGEVSSVGQLQGLAAAPRADCGPDSRIDGERNKVDRAIRHDRRDTTRMRTTERFIPNGRRAVRRIEHRRRNAIDSLCRLRTRPEAIAAAVGAAGDADVVFIKARVNKRFVVAAVLAKLLRVQPFLGD